MRRSVRTSPYRDFGQSALTHIAVEPEVAPSGMIARGHYTAVSKFIDDDNQTHLKFEWAFDIKKDW